MFLLRSHGGLPGEHSIDAFHQTYKNTLQDMEMGENLNATSVQPALIGHDSIITVNNNEKQQTSLLGSQPKVIVSRVKSVS